MCVLGSFGNLKKEYFNLYTYGITNMDNKRGMNKTGIFNDLTCSTVSPQSKIKVCLFCSSFDLPCSSNLEGFGTDYHLRGESSDWKYFI